MRKLIISLTAFSWVLALVAKVSAAMLWGVTNGIGDLGWWTGGQIFTVDPGTGIVTIKANYNPVNNEVWAFGDIAVRANGEIYVTFARYKQWPNHWGFDMLAKVNTTTWGFDWVQDLGGYYPDPNGIAQVNALNFIGDKLYGVTGGGIAANLLKFTLTGSGATITNLGSLGINSDGDIAKNYLDGKVYYTSWETGNTGELNVVNFGPLHPRPAWRLMAVAGPESSF